MNRSTRKPTKLEQARLDAVHSLPCLACAQEIEIAAHDGVLLTQPLPTEADHLVDKGTRKHSGGHMATIALCGWHHRGEPFGMLTKGQMERVYGPSKAENKKAFVERYGGDRILLVETDALIAANRHTEFV